MLNTFRKNTLLKITSLNSLSVITKLITAILVSKIFALFIGPKGFNLIGNLRDFTTLLSNISTLSIEKGIIREASKNKDDINTTSKLFQTILISVLCLSVVLSIITISLSDVLAQNVLHNKDLKFIIISVGITLPLFVLSTVIQSVINGIGNYTRVIIINILISISNPIIIYILSLWYKLEGALFSLAIMPSLYFIITIALSYKKIKIYFKNFNKFSLKIFRKIGSYALMYIPSAIIFPLLYIFIRNYITTHLDSIDAGYYEAMRRVSQNYMLFANSLLSLFLLPEIARLNKKKEIINKISFFLKNFLPFFIIALVLIFLFKNILINILYSKDFEPISKLFKWQLLGDFFRFVSLTIVIVFHANKMMLSYLLTDFILFLLMGVLSVHFISLYGIEGSVIAHFITYLLYFMIVFLTLYFQLKSRHNFIKK